MPLEPSGERSAVARHTDRCVPCAGWGRPDKRCAPASGEHACLSLSSIRALLLTSQKKRTVCAFCLLSAVCWLVGSLARAGD